LAAALAMGIATAATTACAFENEFHGMFSARYINSNFNRTQNTDYGPNDGTYDPAGKNKNTYVSNFIEQRARLQYIAKANADLKLVTHFELDYAYWGNSSYTQGRNQGGAIGADTINIETKSIYLDANPFRNVNVKLGMQPFNDSFKGLLFDADMAGAVISSSYKHFTPTIAYFRFQDAGPGNEKSLGHLVNDMFVLDAKYEVNKDLKIGGAYYNIRDYSKNSFPANDKAIMNVLGLNAEFVTGPLTVNGLGIFEVGTVDNRATTAWALNAGAKLKVGPGTARTEFLYISGENDTTGHSNGFYAVNGVENGSHGYYDNEMVILGRDKNAYTTDNAIVFNSGNKDQGVIGGYIGYDLPINAKLSTAFNAGFVAVAKENGAKPLNLKSSAVNKSNYLGTEINAEANYQLMDGLTTSVRVAYAILGDYYKDVATNGTPENPYDFKLIFKYAF
jgi:hypothetical protein